MDLFTHAMHNRMKNEAPLAARMRPRTLDEYIGQEHILGPGKHYGERLKQIVCFPQSFYGDRQGQARPPWRW